MTDQDTLFAALDEGLAALAAGTPLDQVTADLTARYPALAADLRELLEVAQIAGAGAPPPAPPLRAQARSRAAMLGRAAALRQPRRRAWGIFALPVARLGLTLAVFVGGFAAGTYGAVVASASALPGEPLYAIKRTVENTELLFTGDEHTRNQLEATFTERRIEEVRRLVSAGRPAAVEFTGWLSALDGEHWTVAGLAVTVPAGTPITGTPRPGVWVAVTGQVQPDRTVRAARVVVRSDDDVPLPTATAEVSETLEASVTPSATRTAAASATATLKPATATSTRAASETPAPSATTPASATPSVAVGEDVEFTGVVESIGASAWQIGGQVVRVDGATEFRDNPQVGQTVEVRAVRQPDGSLLATRIRAQDGGGGSGPSATNTPGSGGGSGPSPSNTPKPEDGGGGGSGPSPSNTPKPEDSGGGDDGQSATHTPEPTDDDHSGGGGGGGGGNSGPSPSNTPKPDDD